jgi:hypothetical protein
MHVVAAADLGIGLHTRVAVSEIAHNPLKDLRFLSLSHLGEQPLGFLKLGHRKSSLGLMISPRSPPGKIALSRPPDIHPSIEPLVIDKNQESWYSAYTISVYNPEVSK